MRQFLHVLGLSAYIWLALTLYQIYQLFLGGDIFYKGIENPAFGKTLVYVGLTMTFLSLRKVDYNGQHLLYNKTFNILIFILLIAGIASVAFYAIVGLLSVSDPLFYGVIAVAGGYMTKIKSIVDNHPNFE